VLLFDFFMLSCISSIMSLSSFLVSSRLVGVLQQKVFLASNLRVRQSCSFFLASFHVLSFLCTAITFSCVATLKKQKTHLSHSLISIKFSYNEFFWSSVFCVRYSLMCVLSIPELLCTVIALSYMAFIKKT
jgi:hypothetical protein